MWAPNVRLDAGLMLGALFAVAAVPPAQAIESYAMGVCRTATPSTGAEIWPASTADSYLISYHNGDPRYKEFSFAGAGVNVTLIKAPAHGQVVLANTPEAAFNGWYDYMPNEGYVGKDHFVMLVEKEGVKVRIQYLIEGLAEEDPTTYIGEDGERSGLYCNPEHWKISSAYTTPALARSLDEG